jgi:hypothetical protein
MIIKQIFFKIFKIIKYLLISLFILFCIDFIFELINFIFEITFDFIKSNFTYYFQGCWEQTSNNYNRPIDPNFYKQFHILSTLDDAEKAAKNISESKDSLVSVSQTDKNITVTVNKEFASKIIDYVKDGLPNPINFASTSLAGGAGAAAAAKIVQNSGAPLPVKAGTIVATAGLTALSANLGSKLGSDLGDNIKEFAQDQVVNSNYNKPLPEGRAPSPNPEFNVQSILDRFELGDWSFNFNIPVGDNSPLEGIIHTIHTSLFLMILICIYLTYLIIMQVIITNHSPRILNYLNNNLNFLPTLIKSLIIKILTNITNLHKKFYKYIIIILIINLFYNLFLCIFATTSLLDNMDQFVDVYLNHYKK